jgi:hypothetical protein
MSGMVRTAHNAAPISEAHFDPSPFRGSYCGITVVNTAGLRTWSNPI